MRVTKNSAYAVIVVSGLWLAAFDNSYAMGLRSFVALPVEKGGAVGRLVYEHTKRADVDRLLANVAYGFNSKQALLLGVPYRLSPSGGDRRGDVSALYRHMLWQNDSFSGTDRLGLLLGAIVPTHRDRDAAGQAGFVYTHFKNRHEIDVDALYQMGMNERPDSGRYDISWQYRLSPYQRPDWGLTHEINSVLELNGRWRQGTDTVHQITAGLQWVHPRWVLEGGVAKDISKGKEVRFIVSTRFHF